MNEVKKIPPSLDMSMVRIVVPGFTFKNVVNFIGNRYLTLKGERSKL